MQLMKSSILFNCEADGDRNIVIDTVVNKVDNNNKNVINKNENEDEQSHSSLSSFSLSSLIKKGENIVKPIVTLSVCSDSYLSGYLRKSILTNFNVFTVKI